MCFASAEGDFQMGFVRHTFFRGYDKRLTSAFISNQHPLFSGNIFEFMLNTPRPAFYGVYGQNSTKICFKYNIFDTIRRVFFRGSMASNIRQFLKTSPWLFDYFEDQNINLKLAK